ncbi:MAG: methionyl-tRNA formyltransferase [Candidatus Aureabacteria bacterium]|nr:methionyl-tRNA formyltransferase [Candidatus Auribacterota bacterium]
MKIVFMGTPEVAAKCLRKISEAGFPITGVFTQPDRPARRSSEALFSPVKKTAVDLGCRVFQPEKVSSADGRKILEELSPDVIVIVAFGEILKKEIIDIPPAGCINLHFSLLPEYRGAAPVQWAIINGEKRTGVTVFYLDEQVDAGKIIDCREEEIKNDDTSETLMRRLGNIGAGLLVEVLKNIGKDSVKARPQAGHGASKAPKLSKKDGKLDWNKKAGSLDCFIRGVYPWPSAFTYLDINGRRVMIKIHKAKGVTGSAGGEPGEIIAADRKITVKCPDGFVEIFKLQPEGGKIMDASDFINGYHIKPGDRFA